MRKARKDALLKARARLGSTPSRHHPTEREQKAFFKALFKNVPANTVPMITLFHHAFCPHSRFVRLALGENGLESELVEERVWDRAEDFLAMNPAGTTPVMRRDGQPPIPGAAIIADFLDG